MSTNPTPTVVAGIDGSSAAQHAAIWAAQQAHDRGARLRMLYVIDASGEAGPDDTDVELHYGTQVLDEAMAAVKEQVQVPAEAEVLRGPIAETLAGQARGADLAAVGSVGINFLARLALGSTAAKLARLAPCPVAIIRNPQAPDRTGGIVAAITGGESDHKVMRTALQQAQATASHVVVATAWGALPSPWSAEHAQLAAHSIIAEMQPEFPSVPTEYTVAHGPAWRQLVQLSHDAELIVTDRVAGPGAGRLSTLTELLLHRADCPVLLVGPVSAASPEAATPGVNPGKR